jgi:hypothetical protein
VENASRILVAFQLRLVSTSAANIPFSVKRLGLFDYATGISILVTFQLRLVSTSAANIPVLSRASRSIRLRDRHQLQQEEFQPWIHAGDGGARRTETSDPVKL